MVGPITYSSPQGLHCAGLKTGLFAVVSIVTVRSYEARTQRLVHWKWAALPTDATTMGALRQLS